MWSIMFLATGVLHLVRWRVTGETRAGIRGAATVCLGALAAPTAAIAPMLSSSASTAALTPLSRTVAVVACLSLLARAVHAPAIDTKARPLRALVVTLLGAWAFIAAMLMLADRHRAVDAGNHGWFAIELAMTTGWLLCSIAAARRAAADRNVSLGWLAVATTLMAVAELCRGLAFVVTPQLQYISTGIQLIAALVVLLNAVTELTTLLSAESRLVHLLTGTVRYTERQLTEDEQADSRRRHDARAVLAALRAASMVLDRYDDTLDHEARAELLGSFTSELQRLEQMIERRTDAPLEIFSLDTVLQPALASLTDVVVDADLSPARVQGRPDELAGLVQSVVSTLGRRAAFSRVRVRVTRSTSGVQVACEATAGAMPRVRDTDDDSAGKLRLQIARRIMREQGGDVVVNERWDGSMSVVLWLRPAREVPSSGSPIDNANTGAAAPRETAPSPSRGRLTLRTSGDVS
jgi:hypothetical protein